MNDVSDTAAVDPLYAPPPRTAWLAVNVSATRDSAPAACNAPPDSPRLPEKLSCVAVSVAPVEIAPPAEPPSLNPLRVASSALKVDPVTVVDPAAFTAPPLELVPDAPVPSMALSPVNVAAPKSTGQSRRWRRRCRSLPHNRVARRLH